jgi:hypothetical protein
MVRRRRLVSVLVSGGALVPAALLAPPGGSIPRPPEQRLQIW